MQSLQNALNAVTNTFSPTPQTDAELGDSAQSNTSQKPTSGINAKSQRESEGTDLVSDFIFEHGSLSAMSNLKSAALTFSTQDSFEKPSVKLHDESHVSGSSPGGPRDPASGFVPQVAQNKMDASNVSPSKSSETGSTSRPILPGGLDSSASLMSPFTSSQNSSDPSSATPTARPVAAPSAPSEHFIVPADDIPLTASPGLSPNQHEMPKSGTSPGADQLTKKLEHLESEEDPAEGKKEQKKVPGGVDQSMPVGISERVAANANGTPTRSQPPSSIDFKRPTMVTSDSVMSIPSGPNTPALGLASEKPTLMAPLAETDTRSSESDTASTHANAGTPTPHTPPTTVPFAAHSAPAHGSAGQGVVRENEYTQPDHSIHARAGEFDMGKGDSSSAKTTMMLFKFGKPAFVDAGIADATSLEDLGKIKISSHRVVILAHIPQQYGYIDARPLLIDEKKASVLSNLVHTSLDNPTARYGAEIGPSLYWIDSRADPMHTFEFRYMSGVSAEAHNSAPSSSQKNLDGRKRKIPTITINSDSESDGDHEALKAKVQRLEARLAKIEGGGGNGEKNMPETQKNKGRKVKKSGEGRTSVTLVWPMMARPAASPSAGSWSPSPSPSPPASPTFLSSADRLKLIDEHAPLKPSSLPNTGDGKSPLLFLSPEEVKKMAEREVAEADEEDELPLWEELANAVLWTVPFGFLFAGMDYAVHAQFHQELATKTEVYRLLNVLPTIYLITFLASRPPSRALLPPLALQLLLCSICLGTGVGLIHITTTETYLKVMRQAPGLGVLWVWSVVKMDLAWAVAGLLGVAVGTKVLEGKIEWPWG
ncbi:hypothetical protein P7C70_g3930, partial [Phenoliferia sp. Uapishka_3]